MNVEISEANFETNSFKMRLLFQELQRALSMNLDEAETVIPKLKDDIQALYYSIASC